MVKNEVTLKLPHRMPQDLQRALADSTVASEVWKTVTPLARNEWFCWVTSAKKEETRVLRIEKTISKLTSGMRRPCCFAGCTHRIKK